MNEFLTQLKAFFVNTPEYTAVFGSVLHANFAREGAEFPLAVYTMNPVESASKDAQLYAAEVSFYFAIDQFPECVAFYDTIFPIIKASNFQTEVFTPITDYELDLNKIVVNMKKTMNYLTSNSGGGNGGGNSSIPVISNESSGNYATIGLPYSLQINASNNPTSYSVFNLPEGLVCDEQTGLITGEINDVLGLISFSLSATNEFGTGSKIFFINKVANDISVFSPPVNLSAGNFNPNNQVGFWMSYEILAYSGSIERLEVYKDNELFRTFLNSLFPQNVGVQASFTQLLVKGETYEFKLRLKNTNGEYSEFSEILTVTIPF